MAKIEEAMKNIPTQDSLTWQIFQIPIPATHSLAAQSWKMEYYYFDGRTKDCVREGDQAQACGIACVP